MFVSPPILPYIRRLAVLVVLMPGTVAARASVDRYGDPLPPGAVARRNRARWWCGYSYRPVVYTPDGKSLALCEEVGIVRFLDATTGKELRRIEPPDNCDILFAPAPDGKTAVTGSTDAGALLRLWDVSTGKELRQITNAKVYTVAITFSPDGKTLAVATKDTDIRLWDVATWKETRRITGKRARGIDCLFFVAKGKTLISGDSEAIRWWDIRTGREIRHLDKDTQAGAYWQTIASDGKRLAAVESWGGKRGSASKSPDALRLWDAATGKEISRMPLRGRIERGSCLCFSPDGQTLACSHGVGERGNQTLFFSMATGRELRRWDDNDDWAYHVAFSPDGKVLAQQNMSGVIHLRDAATGKRIQPKAGLPDYVLALRFAPDGKTLIANTPGGRSGFFDALTGKQLGLWHAPPKDFASPYFRLHRDRLLGAALMTDGTKACAGGRQGGAACVGDDDRQDVLPHRRPVASRHEGDFLPRWEDFGHRSQGSYHPPLGYDNRQARALFPRKPRTRNLSATSSPSLPMAVSWRPPSSTRGRRRSTCGRR